MSQGAKMRQRTKGKVNVNEPGSAACSSALREGKSLTGETGGR